MPKAKLGPSEIGRIEALTATGMTIAEAVGSLGVTEAEYRRRRTEFGGLLRALRSGPD